MSTDHNFWRERRAEADSNRGPSAYQLNALPLGQTSSLTELQAAVALWSTQDNTEFQFNIDWRGDNKTTMQQHMPPSPPPPYTSTSREEIIVLLVKGYRKCSEWTFRLVLSPRGDKTCQGDKTYRQCIKFETFCHLSDKTCRSDKMCKKCIKFDTTKRAGVTKYVGSASNLTRQNLPWWQNM